MYSRFLQNSNKTKEAIKLLKTAEEKNQSSLVLIELG